MRALIYRIGVLLLLAMASSRGFAGDVVDRLVASVDNVPILQSDWEQGVAFEALEQQRSVVSFTSEERRAVLDRMVDQQLLRSQMGDEHIATAEEREISKTVEKIRAEFPQAKSDDAWHRLLTEYGMDEAELRQRVGRQLQVMRFVELRLRPEARITRADIAAYYENTLVPAVRSHGETAESLVDASPKIEEILRQQQMDELLDSWLRDLREHGDIQWLIDGSSAPSTTVATSGGR